MYVDVYVYTSMAGTGEASNPREPVIWAPWLDGLMRLAQHNVLCHDIDGVPTPYMTEIWDGAVDTPQGYVDRLVADMGAIGVVALRLRNQQVWEHFQSAFGNGVVLVYGLSVEEFRANALARRDFLWARLQQLRPAVANRMDTSTPEAWKADIRQAINRFNVTGDPISSRLKTWVLGRIDGTESRPLPQGMRAALKDADFTGFRTFRDKYDGEFDAGDFRILLRLWELWCMITIAAHDDWGA